MTTETTHTLIENRRSFLQLVSSTEDRSLWEHPVLDIFAPPAREVPAQKAKLYLVPSTFGEELEADEMPIPTSASELPELHAWTMKFIVSGFGARYRSAVIRFEGVDGRWLCTALHLL